MWCARCKRMMSLYDLFKLWVNLEAEPLALRKSWEVFYQPSINVPIIFNGIEYEVSIKPLTKAQFIETTKDILSVLNLDFKKASTLTEKELAQHIEQINHTNMVESTYNMYCNYCILGITDHELRSMVKKFKFGLTYTIGKQIELVTLKNLR